LSETADAPYLSVAGDRFQWGGAVADVDQGFLSEIFGRARMEISEFGKLRDYVGTLPAALIISVLLIILIWWKWDELAKKPGIAELLARLARRRIPPVNTVPGFTEDYATLVEAAEASRGRYHPRQVAALFLRAAATVLPRHPLTSRGIGGLSLKRCGGRLVALFMGATPVTAQFMTLPDDRKNAFIAFVVERLASYVDDAGLAVPAENHFLTASKPA
jgi:hypothetical protein